MNTSKDNEYINGILFQCKDIYFNIRRDADEGWVWTLYERDKNSFLYDTPKGGYIEGNRKTSLNQIVVMVANKLGIDKQNVRRADLSMRQFFEQIQIKPAFIYRQVQVFFDPIIRSDTKTYVTETLIDTIKKEIDRRLSYPILLKRDILTGKYSMTLIPDIIKERFSENEPHIFIERPDGTTGRLIYDTSIYDADKNIDYDTGWALDLWMEPVYVNWCTDGVWIE